MHQEEQQGSTDHPEAVRSAPVRVPPPDAVPGTPRDARDGRADIPEDVLDDRGTFDDPKVAADRSADDPDETRPYDVRDLDRDDADGRPEFHEPAPPPTAFVGATSVGDAVAASALAGGRPEDERDPRLEDTAMPGDGAPGRTEPFDDERADPTAADRIHDPERWEAEHTGGTAAGVRADEAPAAGAAGYGSAEPTMVDPDSEAPEGGAAAAAAGTGAVGAVGVAEAARPSGANIPTHAATLFEADAAQGFRDRWREVQLRFVDDPRAAVGEAQSLVEEAIQALSDALAAQKEKLGGWQTAGSADTEQLRVAVRQYRDFLDRVLGR